MKHTMLRRLPRHAIVTRMKAAGVTQAAVASRAGLHQSVVSKVIGRRTKGWISDALIERVWAELELLLERRRA